MILNQKVNFLLIKWRILVISLLKIILRKFYKKFVDQEKKSLNKEEQLFKDSMKNINLITLDSEMQ